MTERVVCGTTHPDPDVERRFEALREVQGQQMGLYGGCGKPLAWWYGFRCVTCGRFMHRACLLAHFALSSDDSTGPAAASVVA